MPDVYLKKKCYDAIVLLKKDVSKFVKDAVREKLEREGRKR